MPDLPFDSEEYDVLYHAAVLSAHCGGLTCEIGIRSGGSSELMMRGSLTHRPSRPHVAIDPWGNLPYHHGSMVARVGYDDVMRRECMAALYEWTHNMALDLLVLPWKDSDFFQLCQSGVPFYCQQHTPTLWNAYSCVHFDGPHDVPTVLAEVAFFGPRMLPGSCWVFDDVGDYAHVAEIEPKVLALGFVRSDAPFTLTRPCPRKASYILVD